ncbi:hypothetical protein LguiA_000720 [Lonicera macranthoides]
MLKNLGSASAELLISCPLTLLPLNSSNNNVSTNQIHTTALRISSSIKGLKLCSCNQFSRTFCCARRRVRYEEEEDEDEDEDEDEEEYGHNEEIGMLELYSQSAKEEALLVKAMVDEEEVQILIFKGFSSSLSYRTSADPSRSIVPARAIIKSIDRIKGPFDPSNIQYIEKALTWETFSTRIQLKINN